MSNEIRNVSRRGFLGTMFSAGAFVLGVRCGGGEAPFNPKDIPAEPAQFNPNVWTSVTGGAVNNNCGSPTGNALVFNNGSTRNAVTRDFDTQNGGNITFNMDFGTGANPCENADAGEDVVLEYSNNGGGSWINIATYDTEIFTNWNAVTVAIPAGAQTGSTRFRWRQITNSGGSFDVWGIDNVCIPASPVAIQTAGTASGGTFPVGTTTNTFAYTDQGNNTVNCSFNVTVNDNEDPNAICRNRTVNLNASGNGSVTAAQINNGSTDNCSVSSLAVTVIEMIVRGRISNELTVWRMHGRVASSLAPSFLVGALVTAALVLETRHSMLMLSKSNIWMLPGVWSLIYSLGLFACCNLLHRTTRFAAIYFLLCGCLYMLLNWSGRNVAAWHMVAIFGVGQLMLARILYWKVERLRG